MTFSGVCAPSGLPGALGLLVVVATEGRWLFLTRLVVELSACGSTDLTALLGRDGCSGRLVGPTELAGQLDGTGCFARDEMGFNGAADAADCCVGVSVISPKLPCLICDSDVSGSAGLLKPTSPDDLVDLR
ncbi:hypothetical protein U1Q18_018497 [Sarracenia purpurea var. burkii]